MLIRAKIWLHPSTLNSGLSFKVKLIRLKGGFFLSSIFWWLNSGKFSFPRKSTYSRVFSASFLILWYFSSFSILLRLFKSWWSSKTLRFEWILTRFYLLLKSCASSSYAYNYISNITSLCSLFSFNSALMSFSPL